MIIKFLSILILISLAVLGVNKVIKLERYNNEIIKVHIKLINNCELYDKAFMVKSIPSGKIAKFQDKTATLFLERSSKVKLEANNSFPGFHFSSLPVKVDTNVDLIADCSNSERLDNIFDSLNEQFKAD